VWKGVPCRVLIYAGYAVVIYTHNTSVCHESVARLSEHLPVLAVPLLFAYSKMRSYRFEIRPLSRVGLPTISHNILNRAAWCVHMRTSVAALQDSLNPQDDNVFTSPV
jgi:hypothetical protein